MPACGVGRGRRAAAAGAVSARRQQQEAGAGAHGASADNAQPTRLTHRLRRVVDIRARDLLEHETRAVALARHGIHAPEATTADDALRDVRARAQIARALVLREEPVQVQHAQGGKAEHGGRGDDGHG